MADRRWRLCPASQLGRLMLVLVSGQVVTLFACALTWGAQSRAQAESDARLAAHYIGRSVVNSIRLCRNRSPGYRVLMGLQQRDLGVMSFYARFNREAVPVRQIAPAPLARHALNTLKATLRADLPADTRFTLGFAWPDQPPVAPDGLRVIDLPEAAVRLILLYKPQPAPILVIQVLLEPGQWLYLATLMPNPYFLNGPEPLSRDRLLLLVVSLLALLLPSILLVRSITRSDTLSHHRKKAPTSPNLTPPAPVHHALYAGQRPAGRHRAPDLREGDLADLSRARL